MDRPRSDAARGGRRLFCCAALGLLAGVGCDLPASPGWDPDPTEPGGARFVPLTNFDTPSHRVELAFDLDRRQSYFLFDQSAWVGLERSGLPLKLLELDPRHLLVVGREVFSGDLWLALLDLPSGEQREVSLPDRLRTSIFRQAAPYRGQVVLVLYDVRDQRNRLYRLVPDVWGQLRFDERYVQELYFGGRYEIASNILTAVCNGELYLAGERAYHVYRHRAGRSSFRRVDTNRNVRLIELATDGVRIAGLYQDMDVPGDPDLSERANNPFLIHELNTQEFRLPDPPKHVPIDLRYENGALKYSRLRGVGDLQRALDVDLSNGDASGVMNLGMNNFEARVPWSQVYYLNGFIDALLTIRENSGHLRSFARHEQAIARRLDLEMELLDRLLDADEPALLCMRYTVDRYPAIHAVQTGRVLRLLKRYRLDLNGTVHLANYERFAASTAALAEHIEVAVRAAEDDPWVAAQRVYLEWPRGSPFPYDGVGVPYNQQNDWAGGVTYGLSPAQADRPFAAAARDIVQVLLELEGFLDFPPPDYQWHYWWGQARVGWSAADAISINRPSYAGDNGLAHISYRTIDAMTLLTVGRVFPEVAPPELVDYLCRAVENDGVYLFVAEDLTKYGRTPRISLPLALKYFRMDSAWELQNAVWAYRALEELLANNEGPDAEP